MAGQGQGKKGRGAVNAAVQEVHETPDAHSAGHSASRAKETWLAKAPEAIVKESWNFIKGLAGFFGRRIKGVLGGAWEATGGQITGEMAEIGKRLGYENKETGPLHAIAGIIETTMNKVGQVAGGIVNYGIGAPGRALGRVLRGTQNIVTGAIFEKRYEKGTPASSHGNGAAEAHAH